MQKCLKFLLIIFVLYHNIGRAQKEVELELPYYKMVSIQEFDYSDNDNQLFSKPAMCRWENGLLVAARIDNNNEVILKYFEDSTNKVNDVVLEFPEDIVLWDDIHTLGQWGDFLLIHTFGKVSFFNREFEWIKSIPIAEKIDKLEFSKEKIFGWGADISELLGRNLLIQAYDENFNVINSYSRKIRIPELMYFSQGDLVKVLDNRVVFCEMDRPQFFLLDDRLQMQDSLEVEVKGWLSPQFMPDILPLNLGNIISYFTERGGGKIMGMSGLNDSLILAGGLIGATKDVNILLTITDNNLRLVKMSQLLEEELHYKNPSSVDSKILELSDIRFLCQLRLGHYLDGKFYYLYEMEPGFLGKTYTAYKLGNSFYKNKDSKKLTLTVSEIIY